MSDEYEFEEMVDEMSSEKVAMGSQTTGDKRAEGGGREDVENVDRDEAGGVGTMTDCDGWVLRDETRAVCEGASGIGDAELEVSTTGFSAGAGTWSRGHTGGVPR